MINLNKNDLIIKGVEVLNILSNHGAALIVGGAVRDLLSGEKEPDDVDIATNVPMEKIEELFSTHDIGKNKDFGIVVINYKGEVFEVAQFRKEGLYSDGRHPDSIEIVSDYKSDAGRRDFTINAMAVDKDGNIIDHFGGLSDLESKTLKTVGDPFGRFQEDYLRMLRAVRFAGRFEMTLDEKTSGAIFRNAHLIFNISQERITAEILKMASQSGEKFANSIRLMDSLGLLYYVLPDVHKYIAMPHNVETHPEGGVFDHVMSALCANKQKDPLINMSILFHDIGKNYTYELKGERHTYYAHDYVGSKHIDRICDEMKIETNFKKGMKFCALNHMKFHEILLMKAHKVKALIDSEHFELLKSVALADTMSRTGLFRQEHWDACLKRIHDIENDYGKGAGDELKKVINGKLVMEVRDIQRPCKEIGLVLKKTAEWVLNNNISLNDINTIKEFIKQVEL